MVGNSNRDSEFPARNSAIHRKRRVVLWCRTFSEASPDRARSAELLSGGPLGRLLPRLRPLGGYPRKQTERLTMESSRW